MKSLVVQPCVNHAVQTHMTALRRKQGSFPAGTPGNGVPKVILTVGTAFKPALGELYKKLPVYTKIRLFEIQRPIFFLQRGLHPLPTPRPRRFRRLNPRLRRSNSASNSPPMAPRPPHLLILEPPLFGSHTSFSRKRSLGGSDCLTFNGQPPLYFVNVKLSDLLQDNVPTDTVLPNAFTPK